MDDTLEIPHSRTETAQDGDDHSSGDEDGGLDWTKLPKPGAAARPIIPKRGEKDFEPTHGGGSGLQLHVLDRSRGAMFEALRTSRTISSKTISYGIWLPSIDRVHVTTARGIHFSTMGHFVSRTAQGNDIDNGLNSLPLKAPKRLELLPEEALYLIERGALFCYKFISDRTATLDPSTFETKSPGEPVSVQQAFSEMIGREGMTLERYQVYAYLKRLGFILMRAEPPTPEYPVALPVPTAATQPRTAMRRLTELFSRIMSKVVTVVRDLHGIEWWRPLQSHRQKTTQHIFRALRFIPCGHTIPLCSPAIKSELSHKSSAPSPYKVFFHAYKPSTSFRKTAPPAPDFYIVVVDARTTSVPSLEDLSTLFDTLPEMPLPPPRKRVIQEQPRQPRGSRPAENRQSIPVTASQEGTRSEVTLSQSTPGWSPTRWMIFRRLFCFLPSFHTAPPSQTRTTFTQPKPNPFLALKTGKKTVVIAAVDAGNISFFRFGQAAFEEWPMI